jgi:hypothetical protein
MMPQPQIRPRVAVALILLSLAPLSRAQVAIVARKAVE